VIVQFTIAKDGKIGNLGILEGVYPPLDTECFRIMNSLEVLEPFSKDDKKLMVYRTVPIGFRII